MKEKLEVLYGQMEKELYYLSPSDKESVRKYMVWAFDRGENSAIDMIRKGLGI